MKIAQRIKFHAELWLPWQLIGKSLKKIIKKQPCARFRNNFAEIVVGGPSYKINIFVIIRQKT